MERIFLDENDMPKRYFNIGGFVNIPPPINPATKEPIKPEELAPLFTKEAVKQEISRKKHIKIPEEIREAYRRNNRPTPIYRAERLEKALKTRSKIYFKREDLSYMGSHKTNTALAQAYFASKEGVEAYATETGAGQWGSALSYACTQFGMKTRVYMVKLSAEQKPHRLTVMRMFGAEVFSSPSTKTPIGQKLREQFPGTTGSLGMAISEAINDAVMNDGTKYSIGSVLNHVLLHQTVVGEEIKKQLEPDVLFGCVGGGSNFAGAALPFFETDTELVAVEPTTVPSITEGKYDYDFGETGKLTPLLKMHTLGSDFVPSPIHAAGLRYHGMAPAISRLVEMGRIQARAIPQKETLEAGRTFARLEGLIPAPETCHAIAGAIERAKENRKETILINFSGHGLLDLNAYKDLIEGKIK